MRCKQFAMNLFKIILISGVCYGLYWGCDYFGQEAVKKQNQTSLRHIAYNKAALTFIWGSFSTYFTIQMLKNNMGIRMCSKGCDNVFHLLLVLGRLTILAYSLVKLFPILAWLLYDTIALIYLNWYPDKAKTDLWLSKREKILCNDSLYNMTLNWQIWFPFLAMDVVILFFIVWRLVLCMPCISENKNGRHVFNSIPVNDSVLLEMVMG